MTVVYKCPMCDGRGKERQGSLEIWCVPCRGNGKMQNIQKVFEVQAYIKRREAMDNELRKLVQHGVPRNRSA